jgi:hypothetical protein
VSSEPERPDTDGPGHEVLRALARVVRSKPRELNLGSPGLGPARVNLEVRFTRGERKVSVATNGDWMLADFMRESPFVIAFRCPERVIRTDQPAGEIGGCPIFVTARATDRAENDSTSCSP